MKTSDRNWWNVTRNGKDAWLCRRRCGAVLASSGNQNRHERIFCKSILPVEKPTKIVHRCAICKKNYVRRFTLERHRHKFHPTNNTPSTSIQLTSSPSASPLPSPLQKIQHPKEDRNREEIPESHGKGEEDEEHEHDELEQLDSLSWCDGVEDLENDDVDVEGGEMFDMSDIYNPEPPTRSFTLASMSGAPSDLYRAIASVFN